MKITTTVPAGLNGIFTPEGLKNELKIRRVFLETDFHPSVKTEQSTKFFIKFQIDNLIESLGSDYEKYAKLVFDYLTYKTLSFAPEGEKNVELTVVITREQRVVYRHTIVIDPDHEASCFSKKQDRSHGLPGLGM